MRWLMVLMMLALVWGCATPKATIPEGISLDERALALLVHDAVNQQRRIHERATLAWDERLSRIAQAHSRDMAEQRYFSHTNPQREDASGRAEQTGYTCKKGFAGWITRGIGENLYHATGFHLRTLDLHKIARDAVNRWMTSPGHSQNLLNYYYDRAGIGVYLTIDGHLYITQNFC